VRDGYTFNNGYWYRGSTPHYAHANTGYYNVPYYNNYGGYYYVQQPYTYYTYEQAYPAQASAPAAPTYSKGWQGQLLDIAAARDKVEGELRKNALDQQAYATALQTLGLAGNFRWQNYGASPVPPAPGASPGMAYPSTGQAPYAAAATGNTLYGYTYSSVKDLYGDTNLGSLYQQAARLTQNAQTLAGQANGDFSTLVQTEGSNRSRVAEILAQAQAAAQALQAAQPQPSQHTESRTFSFRTETAADGSTQLVPIPVQPGQQAQQGAYSQQGQPQALQSQQASQANGTDFTALMQNRCASCHSGQSAKGGFEVGSYATMPLAEKAKRVWPLLTHPDPGKRMPKGDKAQRLTPEELRQFYTH
jgi:hypothetical protein